MTTDIFEARRKSMEEAYFRKQDAKLVDKLKGLFQDKIEREALRQKTGITDDSVLDNLIALNVSGEMLAAFQLYPLLEIAWADGQVDEREVRAVLGAAEQRGLAPGSPAYAMLEDRLRNRLRGEARKAWYMYARELCKVLNAEELATFRNELLDAATRVAQASGGLLNVAFTMSPNEKRVLEAIEKALTPE